MSKQVHQAAGRPHFMTRESTNQCRNIIAFEEFEQRLAETFYEQLCDMISKPIYRRMSDEYKKVALEDFKQAWSANAHRCLHGRLVTKDPFREPVACFPGALLLLPPRSELPLVAQKRELM